MMINLLKRKMSSFLGLTAILAALLCCGHCQDPDLRPHDMEDWVVPGDMLKYNSDSRTLRKHRDAQPRPSEKQVPGTPVAPEALGAFAASVTPAASAACATQLQEQKLQTCQLRLQTAEQTCQSDQQSSHQAKGGWEAPHGGSPKAPYGGGLEDQAKDQGSLQDTMQVLETLITGVSSPPAQVNRWQKKLEDYTGQVLMQAVIIVLLTLCLVALGIWSHISWRKQFLQLLLIGFLISLVGTWMHEYKKAHSKQELSKQMARECRTAERTVLDGIFEWFSSAFTLQEDKCANYHEAPVVDAFWEVTLTLLIICEFQFYLFLSNHIPRWADDVSCKHQEFEGEPLKVGNDVRNTWQPFMTPWELI